MKKTLITLIMSIIPLTFSLNSNSEGNKIKMEGMNLVPNTQIKFEDNSDLLKDESIPALNEVKEYLNHNKSITLLRIEGHYFNQDDKNNQDLSSKRALNITKWLINNGIECKRLITVGFGNTKPIQAQDSISSLEENPNNRIVFSLASLRGKLIGGFPADGGGLAVENLCEKSEK
jgi:OOP family OmpA-OmpF porin